MNDKYILRDNNTIREALVKLNDVAHETSTLIVEDNSNIVVGTLTDGDIRRAIIGGVELNDCVSSAMNRKFSFIYEDNFSPQEINNLIKNRIYFIPMLNEEKLLVDIINLSRKLQFIGF